MNVVAMAVAMAVVIKLLIVKVRTIQDMKVG
jgi:hypothetical protein